MAMVGVYRNLIFCRHHFSPLVGRLGRRACAVLRRGGDVCLAGLEGMVRGAGHSGGGLLVLDGMSSGGIVADAREPTCRRYLVAP